MPGTEHIHGTRTGGYKRCTNRACRDLRARIKREERDQHRSERIRDTATGMWIHPKLSSEPPGTGDGPWHGTATGYTGWCCRCLTVPGSHPARPGCGPVGRETAAARRGSPRVDRGDYNTPPEGSTR